MKRICRIMWRVIVGFIKWIAKQVTYRNRLEGKIDSLLHEQKDLRLEVLRVKYLQLVQHSPYESNIISAVFDEYKALGGNSWIADIHKDWKKQLAKGKFSKRSTK